MRIYEGTDISGTLLNTIHGSTFPSEVVARGNFIFITFSSDGSVNHSGWEATWECFIPPGIPPVADFNISDDNPPFSSRVDFSDQSTNSPVAWFWDFGDSCTSDLRNPSHIFYNTGDFLVTLIADNCFFKDSVSKILTVQSPPQIQILTDTLRYNAYTCFDSAVLTISVKNTGTGDLVYSAFGGSAGITDSVSTTYYMGYGDSTIHVFSGLNPQADSIYLEITINGDFDGSSEYATLMIDQSLIGQINDLNMPNGTDITVEYSFGPAYVPSWLSDGNITVKILNSSAVGSQSMRLHKVRVIVPGCKWIDIPLGNGEIVPGETVEIPLVFDWQLLISGSYESHILLGSNDPMNPKVSIPCYLTVDGNPEFVLSDTMLDFKEVRIFTGKKLPVWIYNTGCDTLFILSVSHSLSEFTGDTVPPIIFPNDSNIFDVSFNPESMIEYKDTISIETNIGIYQLALSGKGDGIPHAVAVPDSIFITLTGCEDSTLSEMKIYNTGNGILHYSVTPEYKGIAPGEKFIDDFEDGDLNGWIVGPDATVEIIEDAPYGQYALKIQGSSWSDGISCSFTPDTFNYCGYYYKFDDNPGFTGGVSLRGQYDYQYLYDLWYYQDAGTRILYLNGHTIYYSIENLHWYHIELRDISFQSKQFDFYLDDSLVYEDMPFSDASCNSLSSIYLFNGENGNIIYFDNFQTGHFYPWDGIHVLPETDTVPAGDSSTVTITLNGSGLYSGLHEADLIIETDDPLNPELTVPVSLDLIGSPGMELSDTLIGFDSTMQWLPVTDSLVINNPGCDTLFIFQMRSSSSSFSIIDTAACRLLPGKQQVVGLLFTPDSTGRFQGYLEIKSNAGDTVVSLEGWACPAPDLFVQPDTLKACLSVPYDSIVVPLVLENKGEADLTYSMSNYNPSGHIRVLSLTYGVDYWTEYINTINAINKYFTDYELTEVNTTDPMVLNEALSDQDVLLIAEQESGSGSVFSGFANILQDFVKPGGMVIFCGTYNYDCIFNTGLFSGPSLDYVGDYLPLDVVDSAHPVTKNIPAQIYSQNATYSCNCTNPDKLSLIKFSENNQDVVFIRPIGQGYAVYIGFDFFEYSNETARIISNAINWAGMMQSPEWFKTETDSGIVASKSSTSINTTFYSLDLTGGDYKFDLVISSNDPRKPSVMVPVQLHVTGTPVLLIPDKTIGFGEVYKHECITKEVIILNNGNDVLHITELFTGTDYFRVDSDLTEIQPFDSMRVLISFEAVSGGNYTDTLHIFSDGGNGMVILLGVCMGIPEISTEPDSIVITLHEGDSVTIPLIIRNTGEDTLLADLSVNWWGMDTSWFFVDDFEDADYYGWMLDSSNHSAYIVPSDLDNSNYSIRVTGGFDEPYRGLWKPLDQFSGTYISIYIKPGDFEDHAYFAASDNSFYLDEFMFLLGFEKDSNLFLLPDADHIIKQTYIPHSWYHFEFRDIDFINKTFDFYIDNQQISDDLPFFNKELQYISRLILYNQDEKYTEYDNIYLGDTPLNNFISISSDKVCIDAGQADTVNIAFHSDGLQAGEYYSDLIINSNDPFHTTMLMPCIMKIIDVPKADYSYEQEGCSGIVYFTDLSMNVPDQWTWDFGDGHTSDEQNPLHVYSGSGTYTVSLSCCNELGCDSITRTLILNSIGGPRTSVCMPGVIDQNALIAITGLKFNTIENYENNPLSWYEDFSCDIQTVVAKNETYTLTVYADSFPTRAWIDYNNDGWYDSEEMIMDSPEFYVYVRTEEVTIPDEAIENTPLRMRIITGVPVWYGDITGNCDSLYIGQIEDYTVLIGSTDAPPKARFDYQLFNMCDGGVNFSDRSYSNVTKWSWNFGDDTGSGEKNPVHYYASNGIYQVSLEVTNDYGSDTVTEEINVNRMITEIIHSKNLVQGDTILFAEIGSNGVSWKWSFGDGEANQYSSAVHTYEFPGDYLVKVTVTDSSGCALTDSIWLTIQPLIHLPVAKLDYGMIDECSGKVKFFDLSLYNPTARLWEFGDGQEDTIREPVHQYEQPGEYLVRLTTSNNAGSDSTAYMLSVHSLKAEIYIEADPRALDTIIFKDQGVGATAWVWDFGDGDSSFTDSSYHIYNTPGRYIIKITVSNNYGCELTDSETIYVGPPVGMIDNDHLTGLYVFPNPTDGKLHVQMYKMIAEDLILDILDPAGRIIFNSTIEGTGQVIREIDLSTYTKGLYLLRIWNGDLILSRNILLQ